jgi:serine phosphatase RsbU (regulator of sigma subunit)/streptogramin lyase
MNRVILACLLFCLLFLSEILAQQHIAFNHLTIEDGLSQSSVTCIFQDRKGFMWFGTQNGLNKYDGYKFKIFKNDPAGSTSLTDNFIFSIYENQSGELYIETQSGTLHHYNPGSESFLIVNKDSVNLINAKVSTVGALLQESSGITWTGGLGSGTGLKRTDTNTGHTTVFKHDQADPSSLSDDKVYSVFRDRSGNLWVATFNGLDRLDELSAEFFHYRNDPDDPNSLPDNWVWPIYEDSRGYLWIGTFGGGVNVFNQDSQSFRHFNYNPDDSTSIIDNNIIRVFKDSKSNMWFGTTKGLSRYSWESDNFKNYNEQDGLANSFVYGIVEDDKGNLWLSTNNGLSKFNPEKATFRNYYFKDGLQGNEFNQNAFAKDGKTGNLLFGGPNGFNVFNPDSLKDNIYPPPIEFIGYMRYNTDYEEGKPIIEKGISERDSIMLTYKDNIITLEFAALSYYNNLENQYKYRLEGFNENGLNSEIAIRLHLQIYLRVIGSNNDGVWNEKGTSLLIIVSPPWWKTNIAYGLYFIAFFSFLFGARQYEINRREQKAQIRESALQIKATKAEKRALEIENERKTKELEAARQLQLSMLPKELPDLPDLEIAAFMRTATEVGGDYYDFMVQDDGVLNVAFGDATGHGLQAGTMVTLMKGFFTSDASKLGLQEFLNHCSKVIKEINLGRILMSFSYLKIYNKNLQITSAGMPPIYYYHKETNQVEEIFIPGIPLGAIRNAEYTTAEKELKSGDTILLLSDGLPELMNHQEEMFDYPRVQEHFNNNIENSPDTIIEKLVAAGDKWMDGRKQDDITFVVIRVK